MYTTYGIFDPITKLCVYVGETNDFDRRKRQHLTAHRLRKSPPKDSVKSWLIRQHKKGQDPIILALEHTATNELSLASESRWVELFADIGHPLYNKWSEHQELIDASAARRLDPYIFVNGKGRKIGRCEDNKAKTGYRIYIEDEGAKLKIPFTIDLIPPKDQNGA